MENGLAGKAGRFLARFNCFRRAESFRYSELATDKGLGHDTSLAELEEDDDDDELLFGLDDSNVRGAAVLHA